jgi:hypothetical protein
MPNLNPLRGTKAEYKARMRRLVEGLIARRPKPMFTVPPMTKAVIR